MKRTEPESIGDIMRRAIDRSVLREGIDRSRAASEWGRVVGEHIAGLCGKPRMERDLLIVPVASAGLRQELNLRRTAIVADINARVGATVVRDIRFISSSH